MDISWYIADLIDLPINDVGILVNGCGMDMTFWLADYITTKLFNNKKYKTFKGNGGSCLDWVVI